MAIGFWEFRKHLKIEKIRERNSVGKFPTDVINLKISADSIKNGGLSKSSSRMTLSLKIENKFDRKMAFRMTNGEEKAARRRAKEAAVFGPSHERKLRMKSGTEKEATKSGTWQKMSIKARKAKSQRAGF
jgi:hypothetical protein